MEYMHKPHKPNSIRLNLKNSSHVGFNLRNNQLNQNQGGQIKTEVNVAFESIMIRRQRMDYNSIKPPFIKKVVYGSISYTTNRIAGVFTVTGTENITGTIANVPIGGNI
jgi:hypothetical protein